MAGRGHEVYEHIVKVLLQAEIGSPIYTLLQDADITTLRRLRQYLKKPGLEDKQWRDIENGDTMTDFSGDMKEDLQAIASYLDWLQNHFGPTRECGYYDYTSETRDDFDAYVGCHFDPENPDEYDYTTAKASADRRTQLALAASGVVPHTTGSSGSSSSTHTRTPSSITDFMKGVKRDSSAFPDFKKDAEWDKFRRHCLATAHAQQVHEVFDPNYSAVTGSDEDKVFQLKKYHVYIRC